MRAPTKRKTDFNGNVIPTLISCRWLGVNREIKSNEIFPRASLTQFSSVSRWSTVASLQDVDDSRLRDARANQTRSRSLLHRFSVLSAVAPRSVIGSIESEMQASPREVPQDDALREER